jgi:tetratricopeptide (TPR) repeat protein
VSRIASAIRLRALGRPREALEHLLRELADDPESVPARLELVWVYVALKDTRAALRVADEVLALEPDNPWALYAKANAHGSSGQNEEALTLLDRALERVPECDSFHSYRGAVCLSLRRLDDALASVDRALEIDANDAYSLEVRIRVLRALLRDSEALVATRAALALRPESAKLLQHLGELALLANDPSAAGPAFRAVLQQDPSRLDAKTGLVDALRAKSGVYRALTTFLTWSERQGAVFKRKPVKFAIFTYFGVALLVAIVLSKADWTWILFLPFVVAIPLAFLWFGLYAIAQFALPAFLVPVMFDAVGKHALADSLGAFWKRATRSKAKYVVIAFLGGLGMRWPVFQVPLALVLPLLPTFRLRSGPARKTLTVLAALPISVVLGALLAKWRTGGKYEASPVITMACLVALLLGVAALAVFLAQVRQQRKHGPYWKP